MKKTESGKIVLVIWIISLLDFLRLKFELDLQAWRFKLNSLSQACISSKSTMQLTRTIFPDSVIFIEKKRVENRLRGTVELFCRKPMYHPHQWGVVISSLCIVPVCCFG